jgi:hypothetical protein
MNHIPHQLTPIRCDELLGGSEGYRRDDPRPPIKKGGQTR